MSQLLRFTRITVSFACFCVATCIGVNFENEACGQTSLERVATGLSSGLYLTHAPGDTNRVFMLEQNSARIRVMDLTTNVVSTFMTVPNVNGGGERGLLGLAFDPDYQNNGYFYTYSSNTSGGHRSEVRRFTASGSPATSNTGDVGTDTPVLSFSQPFSNHNGGWIGFNPAEGNSNLYIGTGDGGSGGDPQNNAQDITNNLLGKILRIDVSGDDFTSGAQNYAIPSDNPFAGAITGDDEIWSYGIRNPWRSSFDPATGDMWIGDVGQRSREEINHEPFGEGGRNYGWKVKEGNNCFSNVAGNPSCADPSLVDPVHEYPRSSGSSTTGGYVYRGSVAQFDGLYFFGDFGSDRIWSLDPYAEDMSASVIRRDNNILGTPVGSVSGLSSFGEDGNGEMYVVSYFNGSVFRVSSTAEDAVWNGDAAVGSAGDGSNWNDADNWTRGDTIDGAPVAKDGVIFAGGSSGTTINLNAAREVGSVEFQSSFTLNGNSLKVLSGNITVNNGAVATVNSDLSSETTNTSIRKRGMGRLDVNGSAGQVAVLGGVLGGTGSTGSVRAYAGATVSPGEDGMVGTLRMDSYEQRAGATLEVQIGPTSDRLDVADGTVKLDGELLIDGSAYSMPTTAGTVDQFILITANELTGNFETVSYDGTNVTPNPSAPGAAHIGDGFFVSLSYSENDVTLTNYLALPGDANGDGLVDGLDFDIWSINKFTSGTSWTTADFDGDGDTDGYDFLVWNENQGSSVAAVPEPSAGFLGLLLFATAVFARRQA